MSNGSGKTRLELPQVTLCAATSVNLAATVRALESCCEQIQFASCFLFTDQIARLDNTSIRVVQIPPLLSVRAYSEFVLVRLADFIETSHCLVTQWDGHVLDPSCWDPAFLDYDFIGASWPQFKDGFDVGNGGFSLRSKRLLHACQSPLFVSAEAEDLMIGRTNRAFLEEQGIRFAPRELADRFSAERAGDPLRSFGFHGVWHMPRVIGVENFWKIYSALDDRSTIWRDFQSVQRQVFKGQNGCRRWLRMAFDRLTDPLKKLGKG